MERRETPALQDWTFQACPEKEEVLVSQVHLDNLELQDLLEDLDGMVCLAHQVKQDAIITDLKYYTF